MWESRFGIKISYTSSDIARTMCNSVASEYIFIATLSILQGESMGHSRNLFTWLYRSVLRLSVLFQSCV